MVHITDSCSTYSVISLPSEQGRARRHLRRDAAGSNGSALGLVTRPCHAGRAPDSAYSLRPLPYERPNEFVRINTQGEDWEIVNVAAK